MSANTNLKVIIATHKSYSMPQESIYLPLQVGADTTMQRFGYCTDNTGRNISRKNPQYCELTGLYWAWQNLPQYQFIGLLHYRRRFQTSPAKIQKLLQKSPIILPRKRHYFIENLYNHYAHTLYVEPLELVAQIIQQDYPTYYPEFQKLHHRTSAHMFNIFIMRQNILNDYCQWLFDILFKLEAAIDHTEARKQQHTPIHITSSDHGIRSYDAFHARFYGRISELLLDVYLRTHHLKYAEIPVRHTEPINWPVKIRHFLAAKFKGVKYVASA